MEVIPLAGDFCGRQTSGLYFALVGHVEALDIRLRMLGSFIGLTFALGLRGIRGLCRNFVYSAH